MKQLALFVLSAFVLGSVASAKESAKYDSFRTMLSSVPAPELPAKSAELVKKAKARDWGVTTVNVVKAGVSIKPTAAPMIVGAISKSVPEMAAVAASTAAEAQPEQASAITKAAAAAAPSKAGKIVAAVCRVVPSQYRGVATAASEAAPNAAKEILTSVGSAVPTLQKGIETALNSQRVSGLAVGPVLDKVTQANAGATPRGPIPGGAAYTAPSGTPQTVTPADTSLQPAGGRGYSAP